MNIFVLDTDPKIAATMYCDRHLPKMVVELYQQCGSAVIRHGATPDMMPISKTSGRPLKGGYHRHPCTIFCGDSRENYDWAIEHGLSLAEEYTKRFGKTHACEDGLHHLASMRTIIPPGRLTDFAQAMPDCYRDEDPVKAYRDYYINEKAYFAKWERGTPAPYWWVAL